MGNQSSSSSPSISLPKGGGAIKGIGETFQPNLFSGTGNHSIPIATSPGRSGFGPALSLQYSSGNGNGPFGLGWQLSIPRITRKTEKGLPQYHDDTDVFVMSGAEDLVPCLTKAVNPPTGLRILLPEDPVTPPLHTVYRFRPRTEGLFARIEKWENNATKEVHWRATTKENVTSIYGRTAAARIADPEDEQRVYEWLLQETFDATGNHILYEYARDNPQLYNKENISLHLNKIYDQKRNATQLYIRRIYYGNLPNPLLDEHGSPVKYPNGSEIGHLRDGRRYAFEVVFDYGEWAMPNKDPHPDPLPVGQQELFGPDPSISPPPPPVGITLMTQQQEFFGPDPSIYAANNAVPIRQDPFSSFRAGFEIRTLRRCRRVLMFHHFAELQSPTLVRSTDFEYDNKPDTLVSLLNSVTVAGYQRDTAGAYKIASMPPVTFKYSEFRPQEQRYQSVAAQGNDMPPRALNDPNFALVDLFGDGLPDVLHTGPAGFRYWKNLGGGLLDRPRVMPQIPAGIALSQPGVGFGDMGGDGRADLLVHSGPLPGFFETTSTGTWQNFRPYETFPSFDLADPNVRMVDLTGDGLTDALMTRDHHFLWFECLGDKGFAAPKSVEREHDLDEFPNVYFNDPSGRVRLADMTGDGLNDIVLLHNGRIDYWPNLGYGRFGKRITMENAPRLELNFDPKRLFLADLDGTGCADLVYVDFDRVHFWFNQSGNRWSDQQTIRGTPIVGDVDSIQFADVFGTGTATLLWSYDYSFQPGGNYKALDFCGGIKPYVLTEMNNNMGATTRVRYAPSTKYFLEDQAKGIPWATKLPFPVHVVDKVEVIDHISKTKLVTTYKYHHGYFDGREREFRGFGRVDQFDTETFEDFTQSSLHDGSAVFSNNQKAYHVPPVETRSWFHTGFYFDEDRPSYAAAPFDYKELTNKFRTEFYQGDGLAVQLDDHNVETGETPHEAYRALRGSVLRTEVYGRNGTDKAQHPYLVTETRYRVSQLQPKNGNHHAVYLNSQMESLSSHYERNPADPRLQHALTLAVDTYGNVLKSLAIGYGRRQSDPNLPLQTDQDKQTQTLMTYTENRYTNAIDDPIHDPDNYRTPLPSETRTYELTGFKPAGNTNRFSFGEWVKNDFERLKLAGEIRYEATPDLTKEQKRPIEHVRTCYRKNDLTDLLPLGTVESLALPGESYKLAFTPGLLDQVYQRSRISDPSDILPVDVPGGKMADRGGYLSSQSLRSRSLFPANPAAPFWTKSDEDGHWWIPSGRMFYSPDSGNTPRQEFNYASQHFYLPHRYRDPFHTNAVSTETVVTYDAYDLLVNHTTDPLGNTARAEHDYRLLQPFRVTDPNGNRTAVRFDTLGLVVMTFVMGKFGQNEGDRFDDTFSEISAQDDPTTKLEYDLFVNKNDPQHEQPNFVKTEAREKHRDPTTRWQISYSYSDGFGREIQKKIQAEPGPVPKRDPTGKIIVGADGQPQMTPNDVSPRWVGSGWTIFNNKGKPVQKYEPFFDDTHDFRFGKQVGVSSTLFYDPLERVVATLHPNHTYEKVVFDPWRQATYDVNDTVKLDPSSDDDVKAFFVQPDGTPRIPTTEYLPTWYVQCVGNPVGDPERAAAQKAAAHADTPTIAHLDALSRPFLTLAGNGPDPAQPGRQLHFATRVELDIEGNDLHITDPRGIQACTHRFDVAGRKLSIDSKDAGVRLTLPDVTGKSIYSWDANGNRARTKYDPLRRPTEAWVKPSGGGEYLTEKTMYGESISDPNINKNHRGKVWKIYDGAGLVVSDEFDFKGNLKQTRRRLLSQPRSQAQWSQPGSTNFSESYAESLLEPGVGYTILTEYDALNRITRHTTPDRSITVSMYNEANLLNGVKVHIRGGGAKVFVENIDYNEKGQRTNIVYGNKVQTVYAYDKKTFRLVGLTTKRKYDTPTPEIIQGLKYTYDPAGNITQIQDDAIPTIWYDQTKIDALSTYTYDPLYRLILATGREHRAIGFNHSREVTAFKQSHFIPLPPPTTDAQALQMYTEAYQYDHGGNLEQMSHYRGVVTDPAMLVGAAALWIRNQFFESNGSAPKSNRITFSRPSSTLPLPMSVPDFEHDRNGNLLKIDGNLRNLKWDFKNQLIEAELNAAGNKAYYQYDAAGQRVRKVIVKNGVTEEYIYLGGCEIYRKSNSSGTPLERHTLHVMDDKTRIALVETENPGTVHANTRFRYQLGNHLGSAVLEVDDTSDAKTISYEEYYPYGETSFIAGKDQQEVSTKRYRYSGKERDDETGLYYYGARYYAPWLGRWISCDPAGTVDGQNLYQYARSNPIVNVDPLGFQAQPPNGGPSQPATDQSPSQASTPKTSDTYVWDGKAINLLKESAKEFEKKNPHCLDCCIEFFAKGLSHLYTSRKFKDEGNMAKVMETLPKVLRGQRREIATTYNGDDKLDKKLTVGPKDNPIKDMDTPVHPNISKSLLDQIKQKAKNQEGSYVFAVGPGKQFHSTLVVVEYRKKTKDTRFVFVDNHGTITFTAAKLDAYYAQYIRMAANHYTRDPEKGGLTTAHAAMTTTVYMLRPTERRVDEH